MALSAYAAQALQAAWFGKTLAWGTLSNRPTLYIALCNNAGTEPSGGGYARVQTGAADWTSPSAASPSVISNATIVDFGTASANWLSGANLTKFRMFDAATGGNMVFEANLTIAKPVMSGDPVSFPIGALVVNLG